MTNDLAICDPLGEGLGRRAHSTARTRGKSPLPTLPRKRGGESLLRQRDHAAPELVFAAHVHIVLAHEVELAVGTDAVNREAGGERLDSGAVAYREWNLARCDQHASSRIQPEGAQRNAAAVDVLDQRRLAGRLVDRERRDAVLATSKHLLAFELHRGGGAVGNIERAALGIDVNGPGTPPRRRLGVGERLLDKDRLAGG